MPQDDYKKICKMDYQSLLNPRHRGGNLPKVVGVFESPGSLDSRRVALNVHHLSCGRCAIL